MTTPEKDEVREDQAVDDAVKTETEAEQSSSASDTEDTKAAETNQDSKDSKESEAEDPIEAAKKEAAAWQDKYLRLHAEWDTYRRRMNEQREEEKARAAEKLVEGLIPVIDDFERSIDYAEKNGEQGLLGGVQAVHTKMLEVLTKHGVEMIDPKGEAFNALEALAVATVDDPSVPDETVAEVYQKGYRMGNKVIRSAMVTVTVGGPKREVEESEEDTSRDSEE
ncbi:MAG TPA: nucleotide exchange factor GrpE [Eggerthellaceae bacterium]|nr:nucleotide exchange factor GrpE [Eggerthellaceae bacterium]